MNFGLPFTFEFEDTDWIKKIAIAALISLIPIIGQIYLLGWGLEIAKKVIDGEDNPKIPETVFGEHLGKGFKAVIISLVYSLPVYVLMIPIIIASSIFPTQGMNDETATLLITLVSLCCGSLMFLYCIVLGLIIPAALGNFASKWNLGDGLKFGEVFNLIKSAPVAYLITLAGAFAASFVASLGSIACGVGVLLTLAYSMLVNGHFYGQAYREAKSIIQNK